MAYILREESTSGILQLASSSSLRILKKICRGVSWWDEVEVEEKPKTSHCPRGYFHLSRYPLLPSQHAILSPGSQATSAADGCRDAVELVKDNLQCGLARLMQSWSLGGHPERSFARLGHRLKKKYVVNIYMTKLYYIRTVLYNSVGKLSCKSIGWFPRFCQEVCTIQPDSVDIPLLVTDDQGDEHEMMKDTAILWPWDFFSHLWNEGKFLQWVSDDPATASVRSTQFWEHCEGMGFFNQLGLDASAYASCMPLSFHADGVKVYKNQKAWIYSVSSSCRKGPSMTTKFVYLIVRENQIVKNKTHDSIGKLSGYIMDVLSTGRFPLYDYEGSEFPTGSMAARRAGELFAGGWSFAFASFRGDWEARVIIHKLTRSYRSKYICEHCMASYSDAFTFADFRQTAASQSVRFSHNDFLLLSSPQNQSSWLTVRGWTKDRNLEDSFNNYFNLFHLVFL